MPLPHIRRQKGSVAVVEYEQRLSGSPGAPAEAQSRRQESPPEDKAIEENRAAPILAGAAGEGRAGADGGGRQKPRQCLRQCPHQRRRRKPHPIKKLQAAYDAPAPDTLASTPPASPARARAQSEPEH